MNFRCIKDSGEINVGNVTCFVGKNESGKTSILEALCRVNPLESNIPDKFDITDDYPRDSVSDYQIAIKL
jgi:predicted ATP-dependent endonuclease of OLD family